MHKEILPLWGQRRLEVAGNNNQEIAETLAMLLKARFSPSEILLFVDVLKNSAFRLTLAAALGILASPRGGRGYNAEVAVFLAARIRSFFSEGEVHLIGCSLTDGDLAGRLAALLSV